MLASRLPTRRLLALFFFGIGLSFPLAAGASILPACTKDGNCGFDDFVTLFSNAYGWGLSILGALALFFFVYGGFLWLISGGNEERITRGKKILSGTLVGVIIGLTSWMVINVVIAFLVTKPGETVDFTGVSVLGRPWWNFWGDVPRGCCVSATGCAETTERGCNDRNGSWDKKRCNAVSACTSGGCCIPSDITRDQCADTTNGTCPSGYSYQSGSSCANTDSCKGCCVTFDLVTSRNVCVQTVNSAGCLQFYGGTCLDSSCPSDPRGCCKVPGAIPVCTNDVRLSACQAPLQHTPNTLCSAVAGCP